MKPYYTDDLVTLYHGDSDGTQGGNPILPSLDHPIDAIITDPPYNVSGDKGDEKLRTGKRHDGTTRKLQRNFGEWDHTWTPGGFLTQAHRLLRDGGSLVAFTSEYLIGEYMTSGLRHRNLIYWRKTNPTPAFKRLYVRAVEMAIWQVKGKAPWTWNTGGYHTNVYDGAVVGGAERVHPTQKPLWLMQALLNVHTNPGDLVLDPYAGSGTTLVAAKLLGRRAVGIESSERDAEKAAKRLAQDVLPFDFAAVA